MHPRVGSLPAGGVYFPRQAAPENFALAPEPGLWCGIDWRAGEARGYASTSQRKLRCVPSQQLTGASSEPLDGAFRQTGMSAEAGTTLCFTRQCWHTAPCRDAGTGFWGWCL